MIHQWKPQPLKGPPYVVVLSRREAQVLDLLVEGLPNKQIAAALWVSIETVKTHNRRMYARLGVSDRVSAVAAVLTGRVRVLVEDGRRR